MNNTKIKTTNNILKYFNLDSPQKLYISALFFYILFFLPLILNAYFYCDDKILNESIYTTAYFYNISLLEQSLKSFKDFYNHGRFYGLYFTHYIIYYFFHDRLSYYIVKALFNLLSVLSFAWMIKLLTKNNDNFKAFIFFAPITFLIIFSADPLASQGLSCQYSAIAIGLASGFYILWREKKLKRYAILAFIFFTWSFFHYEIGICILPIFMVLAIRFHLKKQINTSCSNNKFGATANYIKNAFRVFFIDLGPFVIIFLAWVVFCIYLQINAGSVYDGITIGFDFAMFFLAWIRQIYVSLPLGAFHPSLYFERPENYQIVNGIILVIWSYFILVRLLPKLNFKGNYRDLVLIGFILILVPSFTVSLSGKYQVWTLKYGYSNSFVQVFLQFLGSAIIILTYLSYALDNSRKYNSYKKQKMIIQAFAIVIAILIGAINIFNYIIIDKKNIIELQNDKKLFIKAMDQGLLNDMPKIAPPKTLESGIANNSSISAKELFEYDKNRNSYQEKEVYRNQYKLLTNIYSFYTNQNFYYHYHSYLVIVNIDSGINFVIQKSLKLENFYYLENGRSKNDIDSSEYNKYNLEGYLIFGKLDGVSSKCDNSKSMCQLVATVFAPKIFIDKDYLFRIDEIVATLKKRFGEDIFKQSISQIKEEIENSEDGIIITLENRQYNLVRY